MADPKTETHVTPTTQVSSRSVITGPTTRPSTAKVLALPELLCEILDYLPFQDLFSSSRACGGFKGLIHNTKRLREKLPHKMLKVAQPRCKEKEDFAHKPALDASGHALVDRWLLCPLLTRLHDDREKEDDDHRKVRLVNFNFSADEYFADPDTWRPVYLTNPGSTVARIYITVTLKTSSGRKTKLSAQEFIEFPGSLTLGRVVNKVMAQSTVKVKSGGGGNETRIGRRGTNMGRMTFSERIRRAEEEMGVKARVTRARLMMVFQRGGAF